jgi:hypothetical protein
MVRRMKTPEPNEFPAVETRVSGRRCGLGRPIAGLAI